MGFRFPFVAVRREPSGGDRKFRVSLPDGLRRTAESGWRGCWSLWVMFCEWEEVP